VWRKGPCTYAGPKFESERIVSPQFDIATGQPNGRVRFRGLVEFLLTSNFAIEADVLYRPLPGSSVNYDISGQRPHRVGNHLKT
jgi:hypothetical protein